jgi:hypothetical protein
MDGEAQLGDVVGDVDDTGSGTSLFQWDVTESGPIADVAMKL